MSDENQGENVAEPEKKDTEEPVADNGPQSEVQEQDATKTLEEGEAGNVEKPPESEQQETGQAPEGGEQPQKEGEEVTKEGEVTEEKQEAGAAEDAELLGEERKQIQLSPATSLISEFGEGEGEDEEMYRKRRLPDENLMKFYKYMGGLGGEEAEGKIAEEKKVVIKIDRAPYYEKHAALSKEMEDDRLKNNLIQRKLATFFKKKKMDHVLKETEDQFDSKQKYDKKLDSYGELNDIDSRQRNAVSNELIDLKDKRELKCQELTDLFEDMQQREKEIGFGLINTKTGKPIPDKLVERLIRRQRSQMETINGMRLKYIRLKDRVAETQNNIAVLDKIGEDLYLMDYEQLKIENRGLEDKIEERDDELTKLRSKYQSNIQILAHIREKSSALESDTEDLKEEITTIDMYSFQVREQLTTFKQQRDSYRYMTNKLHNESGLLTETELLRDMEDSMEELNLLSTELEQLKEENKIKAQQIRNIRKNIELSTEVLAKKSYKIVTERPATQPQLYKGRPSLCKPTIPEDSFKHLKNFKPKPTFDWNKKKRAVNKKN